MSDLIEKMMDLNDENWKIFISALLAAREASQEDQSSSA